MIYFFYGSDEHKARTKAFEWIAKARAKEPNLAYVRLAREDLSEGALEDAAHAGGLFVSRLLVLLDDPFPPARSGDEEEQEEEPAGAPLIEEYLESLAASENAVVILAPKLAPEKAKKIVDKAKLTYKYDVSVGSGKTPARGFNTALVDAIGDKNGARLWLEINRAFWAGDAPEMLHGLLHWKARDIMAKGSRTWRPQEARDLSLELIALLQESRRGGLSLPPALERFTLSL
ncbi:hypothetical protein COU19_01730 [Candidatus Kaiserbacteria bacterium CG10_big_fil_rev_8_21_14_0_10_56_12]|uniref:DNA polymerase III delta N-terminal domain-containing protein n=1 Tax=Candidatus Kaiserbacteria bacterium CG10_big_fil_rev_8_21_14_0_10_56_12 TaxID=1974611 RepID=A0A2H0UBR5_9BACT|nr:MAG: hypothetical protein COU19_01730 [Candidatus Kaiserbacteria bacterium CG10_big_fil_rev_8_21_14_0_10_56_12]